MRKDTQRNRDQILSAAASLIARKGGEVTIAEVVKAAAVKEPTLYRHFGSKDGLLKAVHELRVDFIRNDFELANAEPTAWDGARLVVDHILAESSYNAYIGEWPSALEGTKLEHLFIAGWT